jgi:hypothetical protein
MTLYLILISTHLLLPLHTLIHLLVLLRTYLLLTNTIHWVISNQSRVIPTSIPRILPLPMLRYRLFLTNIRENIPFRRWASLKRIFKFARRQLSNFGRINNSRDLINNGMVTSFIILFLRINRISPEYLLWGLLIFRTRQCHF